MVLSVRGGGRTGCKRSARTRSVGLFCCCLQEFGLYPVSSGNN